MDALKVEPIPYFADHLPRIRPMGPPKSVAVIHQETIVGRIDERQSQRPLFPNRLAERKIHEIVSAKVLWSIAIHEARSIGEVRRYPSVIRQINIHAGRDRRSLIMVKE